MPKVVSTKTVKSSCGLDIEVPHTHSYLIVAGDARVVTHNTVSLLAGAVPGIHYPLSQYYIRRMRLANDSPLIAPLKDAGYHIEPCKGSEKTTAVVEFPIGLEDGVRTTDQVKLWEKYQLVAFTQAYWSDNQVSVTLDFDPETEADDIVRILEYGQYTLKSVSFLPRSKESMPFPQMPYERITKERYLELKAKLRPINFGGFAKQQDEELDFGCDGGACSIQKAKDGDI
jgi:ribonucleoside-triphosphate reductase